MKIELLQTHSLWRYLMLLAAIPLLVWQLTQNAQHSMDVEFARRNPDLNLSMTQACQGVAHAQGLERCKTKLTLDRAHGLAIGILFALKLWLGMCAALTRLPERIRSAALKRARLWAGFGLLLTWILVAARGAVAALAIWVLPMAWWGREFAGLAAVVALTALVRLPRHAMTAWRLATETRRFVVGKIVEPSEAPEIWAMMERASLRLRVPMPRRLILGMRPGARLETGSFLLEPHGKRVRGRSLYLGITLAQSLGKDELENLIESALSRTAGPHGGWLPEVQDAYQNAAEVLRQARLARENRRLNNESDPALEAFASWLSRWSDLLEAYEAEDAAEACRRQAAGAREMERARADMLIGKAQRAWTNGVFPRFMLAVSFGEKSPATQTLFDEALREAGESRIGAGSCWRIDPALYAELVAKDTVWMALTGQVALIGQSWELLGIHGAQREDGPRQWDFSLRLN